MHLAAQSGYKTQPGGKRRWVFPLPPCAGDQDASGWLLLSSFTGCCLDGDLRDSSAPGHQWETPWGRKVRNLLLGTVDVVWKSAKIRMPAARGCRAASGQEGSWVVYTTCLLKRGWARKVMFAGTSKISPMQRVMFCWNRSQVWDLESPYSCKTSVKSALCILALGQ